MKLKDKVCVVTGAGSGLGQQVTLKLLNKGAWVAMADINEQGLDDTIKLAGDLGKRLSKHVLNITDKEKVLAFPEVVKQTHGNVDAVLNIAGIIQPFVKLQDLDFDAIDRVMQINFYGSVYMIKAFLPELLQRPVGYILNTSSMGGFLPVPGQTIYGASKAAIKLMTEGLYSELKDTNVHVTLVLPGAMDTNIAQNSGVEIGNMSADEQAQYKSLSPDKAADQMIHAMEHNEYRVLLGQDANMMDKLYRISPEFAANFIYKQMKNLLK